MRTIGHACCAAFLLASCSESAPVDSNDSPEATENGALASPPPPVRQPIPEPGDSIPSAFHGTYDESREDCERPSEYRLRVEARALRFHESIGEVKGVSVEGPRLVSVSADYQGEGESWHSVRRMHLSDDGATLTVSGDGTEMVRIRCP